jgi:hypothetical protein
MIVIILSVFRFSFHLISVFNASDAVKDIMAPKEKKIAKSVFFLWSKYLFVCEFI